MDYFYIQTTYIPLKKHIEQNSRLKIYITKTDKKKKDRSYYYQKHHPRSRHSWSETKYIHLNGNNNHNDNCFFFLIISCLLFKFFLRRRAQGIRMFLK